MGERDLVLQCLGRCVAIYTRCKICDGYDFICRVFCRFIDTRAGVVFGSCSGKRWSVRSGLGRLHMWWLWRRQSGFELIVFERVGEWGGSVRLVNICVLVCVLRMWKLLLTVFPVCVVCGYPLMLRNMHL
jgi:hypothetical protein